MAAKATSCTKAAAATTASKASSATSAVYSSTANYAKASAGATTASKATSATSATYSSTSNYAKAVPSTVASRISTLETSFQDGCNTIMQAVTAKGSTPASNSPADIVTAINAIPSIEGSSLTSSWSGISSALSTAHLASPDGLAEVSKSIDLVAGRTYILFGVAIGCVSSGYSTDGGKTNSTYPNTNWRITEFTITSNKTNDTLETIDEQLSVEAGKGIYSYKMVRIKSTVSQNITVYGKVTGYYGPSIAVGVCQIYSI